MLIPADLSPDQKNRIKRLAISAASKFILAAAASAGKKLGELLVEALFDKDEDDEPTEPDSQ